MISVYQTALSGLKTFSNKLESNSNNIANASTNGFKKSVAQDAALAPMGVEAKRQKGTTPGPGFLHPADVEELADLSSVDLATELVSMKLNSTMFKANLKTIQAVDNMTATLLDIKS